mgnify:CR=1 FL=1
MGDTKRAPIHRIHGTPDQWLAEFLSVHSSAYEGRVTGVCVHLEVKCEDDPESREVICWKDWPSRVGLAGHLFITLQQLTSEVIEP